MIKIITYTPNPLSIMGTCATRCWGSNPPNPSKVAIECIENGHGRVSEFADVTIEISGYSARMIRELYTHIIGTSRLQSSTRYINYGEFDYYIPDEIKNDENALIEYQNIMKEISKTYKNLEDLGIKKEHTANILPLGMESTMILKINVRALLHMAEVRMCTRAYIEFRQFMKEFLDAISEIDDEWKIISTMAKPKCEVYGYCNERFTCGRKPRKE